MRAIQIPQVMDAIQKLSADKLKMVHDFVQYLIRSEYTKRHLKPRTVVFIPADEYEELQSYRKLSAFQSFARNFGGEIEKKGISEEEFLADVKKTRHELFAEKYEKLQ
jgi:hypothetical protein